MGTSPSAPHWCSVLVLVNLALIGPCIAALQVQAVLALSKGEPPQLATVLKQGINVLPVVAGAEIIASAPGSRS
jgi:hypothetical protein